jgi:hypothetical protein
MADSTFFLYKQADYFHVGGKMNFKSLSVSSFAFFFTVLNSAFAQPDPQELLLLMKRFAPLVKFHHFEDNFPSSVDWYVQRCQLGKYKDQHQKECELILEHPELNDIKYYSSNSYFFSPPGSRSEKEKVWQGEPLSDTHSPAPCYAHWLEKPDGAVIQYLFFYPYNGTLFYPMKYVENYLPFNIGQHEGDWEHIDVHLDRANENYTISQIYFSRHRGSRDGSYLPAKEIELFEETHPVVYSSYHGHASYGHPIWLINRVADRTSTHGPEWQCWQNLVDVGTVESPEGGQEWIRFQGNWGQDGPSTPSAQEWWRTSAHQLNEVLEIPLTFPQGSRNSKNFSLRSKIPTRIKKLRWHIEHPDADRITFSVHYNGYFSDVPIFSELSGNGSTTEIPRNLENLYISKVQGIDLESVEDPIRVVVEIQEE